VTATDTRYRLSAVAARLVIAEMKLAECDKEFDVLPYVCPLCDREPVGRLQPQSEMHLDVHHKAHDQRCDLCDEQAETAIAVPFFDTRNDTMAVADGAGFVCARCANWWMETVPELWRWTTLPVIAEGASIIFDPGLLPVVPTIGEWSRPGEHVVVCGGGHTSYVFLTNDMYEIHRLAQHSRECVTAGCSAVATHFSPRIPIRLPFIRGVARIDEDTTTRTATIQTSPFTAWIASPFGHCDTHSPSWAAEDVTL